MGKLFTFSCFIATAVLRQSVAFRITAFELQRMDMPNYRCQIDIFLLMYISFGFLSELTRSKMCVIFPKW